MTPLPPAVEDVAGRYLRALDDHAPGIVEGVYLTGSVAVGDFRPGASDVDFVAVTAEPPDDAAREALRRVHARIRAERRRPFFDGSYITWDELRRDPASASPGPNLHEGRWKGDGAGARHAVTWHELAWHGVAVRGPDRREIELWTDASALVRWNRENMASYWRRWHARAARPLSPLGVASLGAWAPAWGVLGVARQRYTIATGKLTSKYGAGRYARELFPARWHRIIDEALRIRAGSAGPSGYANPIARRRDMLDFIELAMAEVLGPSRWTATG